MFYKSVICLILLLRRLYVVYLGGTNIFSHNFLCKQFRHSDGLDKTLLFLGLLSGLLLGSMWPTLIVITGQITDVLVTEALDKALRDDIVNNATLLFNLSDYMSPKDIV